MVAGKSEQDVHTLGGDLKNLPSVEFDYYELIAIKNAEIISDSTS